MNHPSPTAPTTQVGPFLRFLNRVGTSRWTGGLMRAMVPLDALLQRRSSGSLSVGRAVGLHSLLLTTTGARTGEPRQVPLFHVPHADGFAVIDSNLGADSPPAWSHNLRADPRATVVTRGRRLPVVAREAHGTEREEIWRAILSASPGYAAYDTRCTRELRIFHLRPTRQPEPNGAGPEPRGSSRAPRGRDEGAVRGRTVEHQKGFTMRKGIAAAGTTAVLAALSTNPATAITGGAAASPQDALYAASVHVQDWLGKTHVCSGVLIKATKVLTAAQCVDQQTASTVEVRWGGVDRARLPHSSGVSRFTLHTDYNATTRYADLAVLTLSTPADETDGVEFAKLATTVPTAATTATVTGWGRTASTDTHPSPTAQTARIPITDPAVCEQQYPEPVTTSTPNKGQSAAAVLDTATMTCAGGTTAGTSICTGDGGDSGAPLSVNGTVAAIASWSRGCGESNSPAVFTSVHAYADWIHSQ